jgi:glycosyltransferase involved in cell wall biosynthesis
MTREQAEGLARERAERRAEGDYAAADALRERIHRLGFEVIDRADGYDLVESSPEPPRRLRTLEVESVLDRPETADWSVHWLAEGWPDDVRRGIDSFRKFQGDRRVQHVVVEAVPADPGTWPDVVEVIHLDKDPGFGAARNAGLRRSTGRDVAVVDGSLEATGDVFGPLEEALADRTVGVAGPFALVTGDLREFRQTAGPEADAIEGHMMAFRREVLERDVVFNPRYRFYRWADVDLSFRLRERGLRALRVEVPLRRHPHRRWESLPPERREALSKRNFYRFLDRWRGRTDLLTFGDRGSRSV